MNPKFKNRLALLTLILLVSIFSFQANAQDAEKQKIVDVIQGELDAFIKKDRTKWSDYWIQTDQAITNVANAYNYQKTAGWDSLNRAVDEYFKAPGNPFKSTKSDFVVTIKGSIALVDLVEKSENFVADQVVVLEKKGKSWKILRMYNFDKSTYEATDQNVEGIINSQGYQLLKLNKIDEAIKVFALNTELFPEAWNTWDSLGEAYAKKGEKDIAVGYYKKSIALNPKNENGKKIVAELTK